MTTVAPPASPADKPQSTPHRLRHIRELDGIRGIAALMVFFHHAARANLSRGYWHGPIRFFIKACEYCNYGVDLFFVLSGFLITSILLLDRTSPRYYQDFYWKRGLRILPLYTVCSVLAFAVSHDVSAFAFRLFFLANMGPVFHVASSGPFWTLAIEEQFYLVWPTLVRRRSPDQILRWAIALGLTAAVLRFVFAHFGHHNYSISFLRCDGLAFGAVLACHFRKPHSARRDTRIFSTLLLVGAAALLPLLLSPFEGRTTFYQEAVFQTGIVLLSGSLIGLTILHTGSRALAFLRSRFLVFFGLISFALYMVHDSLLSLYDHYFGPIYADQSRLLLQRMAVVFLVTVALSLVSRYLIELPAMSLRKYVLQHPNPAADHADPPLPLAPM